MTENKSTGGQNRRLVIGVIIIGAFISSLNQTVMTASLPKIMVDFGIEAGVGQWLTTAYLLFMGVMIPCTGYLMERFSPKKLYLASVSLFLIGCAVAAFSRSISVLLAARIIQALGAGILLPLPQVVAFRLYEPEKRGAIMGIVGLTTGFAPAFGPTFAGWVADTFGWRAIFYIMCTLSVLGIILALFKLPDEEMHSEGHLDLFSVLLSTVGFCGLLTGVTNQGNYGITSMLTVIPFVAGAVCVALFAIRQLKLPKPLLELRVFKSRNFTFGTVLLVFAYGSMLSVSTLMPVYIQNLRGYSATASGLVMLPGAMFLAFLNPLTGRILDRKGPYLLSMAGLVSLGGATLGLSFMNETTPLWMITFIYAFRMLGIVALLQPLQTWAVNSVSDQLVAHGTALMNTVRQVGGAIVSALLVTVMSMNAKTSGDMRGIQLSFIVTAVMVFVCLAAAGIFMRPKKTAGLEFADGQPESLGKPEHSGLTGRLGQPEHSGPPAAPQNCVPDQAAGHIVITIAREYGSGGREIGQRIAQKLGIPFYDRELIALEARESGFSDRFVETLDEALPAGTAALDWAAKSYGAFESGLYESGNLTAVDQMYQAQRHVIQTLAQNGSCVIIGRCANYILQDVPGCLSLFICSDPETKRGRILTEYGIGPDKADSEMKRKDGERAFHHKRYTGQNWGDHGSYHMILNSGKLGIEQCVEMVAGAVRP